MARLRLLLTLLLPVLGLSLGGCQNLPPLARPERYVGPPPLVYYVRRGDTFYSIGKSFGLDPAKIRRWNPDVDPADLRVGQALYLRRPPWREWTGGQEESAEKTGSSSGAQGDEEARRGSEGPAQVTAEDARALEWQWPLQGEVIQGFSAQGKRVSNGIHIAADEGTKVRAAAPGKVVYAGDGLRGYGNLVIVRHEKRYLTAYGYNRKLLVTEDEEVAGGQALAEVGRTGAAEQASLHFEVRRRSDPIDPLGVLPER